MDDLLIPEATKELDKIISLLQEKKPFSFIRFSDGEIEVLRNRYLEIKDGKTVFRGRNFENNFPKFDTKRFDPSAHQSIRKDLLHSAVCRDLGLLKGIPTAHNGALKDREFLLRLNGGYAVNMTFSDLFLNSNYLRYRKELVPLFTGYKNIYVIANYRAKLEGVLEQACHIKIPDNFFANYDEVLSDVLEEINNIEEGALILSSASSLTNIIGHKLFIKRSDLTFLDIGTSLNDLLCLNLVTRAYHSLEKGWVRSLSYRFSTGYKIKW